MKLDGIHAPHLIIGFPGFGMAASIATQYLVEHVSLENLGRIDINHPSAAFMAVHEKKIIWPITLYYLRDKNLLFFHSLIPSVGIESEVYSAIKHIVDTTNTERIVLLESIAGNDEGHKLYIYTQAPFTDDARPLTEGVLLGLAPMLYANYPDRTIGYFTEAHINLPDSEAASILVGKLDDLYSLSINRKELAKLAEQFESQLKSIIKKSKNAQSLQSRQQISYVG